MRDWISVAEKLPDPDTTVEVLMEDGAEQESYFGALIWSKYNLFFCNLGSQIKVTHWTPKA